MSERPLTELAREITAGAVRMAAATAAWLRLIAEFDAREGWGGYGIRSCAHWLAWQCGLSPNAAREHVRVARALTGLPLIGAAFEGGRLSYSKVRALTRVAEPGTEAELLEFAIEATASQTERTVRQWRRADARTAADDAADDAAADDRYDDAPPEKFDTYWDEAGMLVVRARLNLDNGASFLAGITSLTERAARRDRAAAKRADAAGSAARRGASRRAGSLNAPSGEDAGVEDAAPSGSEAPCCGADDADDADDLVAARAATTARRCAALGALASAAADADRRAGDPPRREVTIHVDSAVLADDAAAGRAYLDGGPALSSAQARRLLCEATVLTMLESGREVLALGRRRRLASRAQRRALLRRDGGCARPGCTETRLERLHAHHMRHWLFGGRTDLPNLVLLCDHDHGLAHDLDLVMTRRDGRLIATTPDGRRVWGPADAAFTLGLTGLRPTGSTAPDPAAGAPAGGAPGADAPGADTLPDSADRGQAGDAGDTATTTVPRPNTGTATTAGKLDGMRNADDNTFIGVHPIDLGRARRPAGGTTTRGSSARSAPGPAPQAEPVPAAISHLLFPDGEPALPDAMHVNGERMSLAYAVSVLMGHRDHVHRLAAETGVDMAA